MGNALRVHKPLVFLVEDSDPYRIMLQRHLEHRGFNVLCFRNGVEAYKKLFRYNPRAIISDIQMPRMDGFELKEAASDTFPNKNFPFIYISSKATATNRAKAKMLGVEHFHAKPLDTSELANTLTNIITSEVA